MATYDDKLRLQCIDKLKIDGTALCYSPCDKFKKDREIVFTAVNQNGYSIQYADESFKSDYYIILTAVTQNGYSLVYANDKLKNNFDIVKAAVKNNGFSIAFASPTLQQNTEIALIAVQKNGFTLDFCHNKLKVDNTIVSAAIKNQRRSIFCSYIPFHETWWRRPGPIYSKLLLRHMNPPFNLPIDLQQNILLFIDNDKNFVDTYNLKNTNALLSLLHL